MPGITLDNAPGGAAIAGEGPPGSAAIITDPHADGAGIDIEIEPG
jgi:hypothetical protein